MDVSRFATWWHQIDAVRRLGGKNVLEIAGADDFLAVYLRRVGVDVASVTVERLDAVAEKSVDAAVAFDVLAVDGIETALGKLARVSRGGVAISVDDPGRVFAFDSSFGKIWSFRFLLPLSRATQKRVARAAAHAGLAVRRHWRVHEEPTRHFFLLEAARRDR